MGCGKGERGGSVGCLEEVGLEDEGPRNKEDSLNIKSNFFKIHYIFIICLFIFHFCFSSL
jgi:hypothetical protein